MPPAPRGPFAPVRGALARPLPPADRPPPRRAALSSARGAPARRRQRFALGSFERLRLGAGDGRARIDIVDDHDATVADPLPRDADRPAVELAGPFTVLEVPTHRPPLNRRTDQISASRSHSYRSFSQACWAVAYRPIHTYSSRARELLEQRSIRHRKRVLCELPRKKPERGLHFA